jgi:hypothetical protein
MRSSFIPFMLFPASLLRPASFHRLLLQQAACDSSSCDAYVIDNQFCSCPNCSAFPCCALALHTAAAGRLRQQHL